MVNSGTSRNKGAGDVRQTAVLAQHGRVETDLGADPDAGPGDGNARLRVGRQSRQRLPPARPHLALVDHGHRGRDVHRLRHRSRRVATTETHSLSLYRAPSGALVFGAGTVQWSWGLDVTNAWNSAGPERHRTRPDDAAGDRQPAGRHGGAAGDPPVRSHRHPGIDRYHPAERDRHLAVRRSER